MKQTKILMGMPLTIEIIDSNAHPDLIDDVFSYLEYIDKHFSPYKPESEVSKINNGLLKEHQYSKHMREILALSELTKKETNGFFNIQFGNKIDPSGLVKGWAVYEASKILTVSGIKNCYIEAGGDVQVYGKNYQNKPWTIGIRNPFDIEKIVKVIQLENQGVATSGIYYRGSHIYNPKNNGELTGNIVSLTVVGPNIYEADRFATAAFAMGFDGINFIEKLNGFEAYMIDHQGIATYTTNFNKYISRDV